MLLNRTITYEHHKKNFLLLLWQSFFFMLTINILDKDTVLPGLLKHLGANETYIGLLSMITIGLPKLSQIFFGQSVSKHQTRKRHLINGFLVRFSSLLVLGFTLWNYYLYRIDSTTTIILIFLFYTIYSLAAAYTSVSIVDLAPRCIFYDKLKKFYSLKQVANSLSIFVAVFIVRKFLQVFPYPLNYSVIHFLAAGATLISTLALFGIYERIVFTKPKENIREFFRHVYKELSTNRNLLLFALIVNSEGLFLSIVPFFTTYAMKNLGIDYKVIGTLFLWKIIGVLTSSLILFLHKNFSYKKALFFNNAIAFAMTLFIVFFHGDIVFYKIIFFLVGVFNSLYRITYEGVIVELSDDKNRAMYVSIIGSSNISTLIVPVLFGSFTMLVGYKVSFVISALLLSFAFLFLSKLKLES